MTCQECELLLGAGAGGTETHLETCAECRALAAELSANTIALEAMRFIEIPAARVWRPRWEMWGMAAAAAIVVALLGSWWMKPPALQKPPLLAKAVPAPVQAPLLRPAARNNAVAKNAVFQRSPKTAPLTVKILTDDPDVVIYWLVDGKEGF